MFLRIIRFHSSLVPDWVNGPRNLPSPYASLKGSKELPYENMKYFNKDNVRYLRLDLFFVIHICGPSYSMN